MESDQVREHAEHAEDLRIAQLRRLRVDGAERPEERSVAQDDGDGDAALKAEHGGAGIVRKFGIVGHAFDRYGAAAPPRVPADGRVEFQLAAGLEAEADLVAHLAGNPAVRSDARHGGETHAGRAAGDIENRRHCREAPDGIYVGLEIFAHARATSSAPQFSRGMMWRLSGRQLRQNLCGIVHCEYLAIAA